MNRKYNISPLHKGQFNDLAIGRSSRAHNIFLKTGVLFYIEYTGNTNGGLCIILSTTNKLQTCMQYLAVPAHNCRYIQATYAEREARKQQKGACH